MSVVGEVFSAINAAITVGKIVAEAFAFRSECQNLAARCKVVQTILETHQFSADDVAGLTDLSARLTKVELYLSSCRERRLMRNPLFEVTFHRRIGKHISRLDGWILLTTLSLVVFSQIQKSSYVTRGVFLNMSAREMLCPLLHMCKN